MFGGLIKRSPADAAFSEFIRYRDHWTCQRCRWPADPMVPAQRVRLHCSHFITRANVRVRFDPNNAAAMCMGCHDHLGKNPADHRDLWLKRLGQAAYDILRVIANTRRVERIDESLERIKWAAALEDLRRQRGDIVIGAKA